MAVHAETNCVLNTIPAYTSLLGGHFVYKSNASSSGLTLPSANIIQNLHDNPVNWGYNTNIGANGINLRYNEINLSQWSTTGLIFYLPVIQNGNVTQGYKGLEITNNAINIYNPSTHNADAILDSNGLILSKGGIKAGLDGQSGFIYISSEDYQLKDTTHNGITINGHTPTAAGVDGKINNDAAWRQIIGTNFGVDADGILYAQHAVISGQITIGNHDVDRELTELKENIDNTLIYDHTYEFEYDETDLQEENPIAVTFYAHVYRGGLEVTDTYSGGCFAWYYKSEDSLKELPISNNPMTDSSFYTNVGRQITIGSGPKPQIGGSDAENYIILDDIKYGVEIISKFNPPDAAALATTNNQSLVTTSGRKLLSATRSNSETIRVKDLSYTTSLSSTDAIMIVTDSSEQLITLSDFTSSLNVGVSDVRIINNSIVTNGIANIPLATSTVNGVMSASDKTKLDNLPSTFVSDITDVQIDNVSIVTNRIATIPYVSTTAGGLMSAADKVKLNGLPSTFDAGVIDVKINNISIVSNGTANIPLANTTTNGIMSKEDKIKLNNLPSSFVSDVSDVQLDGVSILSNKIANIPLATTSTSGAMSAADKLKLNNLPEHFSGDVSDVQINGTSILSNGIANLPLATDNIDGIMSKEDKGKLESLKVVIGGVGLVAINRLSFDPDRKSLKIFDVNMDILPTAPTTNGTYTLQVDVNSTGHTYSWV